MNDVLINGIVLDEKEITLEQLKKRVNENKEMIVVNKIKDNKLYLFTAEE